MKSLINLHKSSPSGNLQNKCDKAKIINQVKYQENNSTQIILCKVH